MVSKLSIKGNTFRVVFGREPFHTPCVRDPNTGVMAFSLPRVISVHEMGQRVEAAVDGRLHCLLHVAQAVCERSWLCHRVHSCRCIQGGRPKGDGGSSGPEYVQLYKTMSSCFPE